MTINWHFIIRSWDFLLESMKYAITSFTKMLPTVNLLFIWTTHLFWKNLSSCTYDLHILSVNKKCRVGKHTNFTPLITFRISLTYMINSRGLRTEPWGTTYPVVGWVLSVDITIVISRWFSVVFITTTSLRKYKTTDTCKRAISISTNKYQYMAQKYSS